MLVITQLGVEFAWAAITKYSRLGGLDNRHVSLPVLESENQVWAGLVPPEAFLSSLCPPSVCVCALISSSYKDTSPMGSGPTLVTSLYLHPLFRDPTSKSIPILRSWESGRQHMDCRGT